MRCAAALLCAVLCCTLRCMGVAMGGAQRLLFGAWLLLNFIQHAALISEYHKHFKLFHCSAKKVWMQSVTSSGQWKGEREERRVKSEEERVQINFNWIQSNWMPGILLTTVSNAIKFNCKFIAGHSEYSPPTHSLSGPSSSEWPVSTQPPTRRTLAFKSSELLFIAHSHARSITPNRIQNRKCSLVKGKGRQLSAQEGQLGATLSAVFNYLVGCLICWHFWFGQTDRQTDAHGHSHCQFGLVSHFCLCFSLSVLLYCINALNSTRSTGHDVILIDSL